MNTDERYLKEIKDFYNLDRCLTDTVKLTKDHSCALYINYLDEPIVEILDEYNNLEREFHIDRITEDNLTLANKEYKDKLIAYIEENRSAINDWVYEYTKLKSSTLLNKIVKSLISDFVKETSEKYHLSIFTNQLNDVTLHIYEDGDNVVRNFKLMSKYLLFCLNVEFKCSDKTVNQTMQIQEELEAFINNKAGFNLLELDLTY